MMEFNSNLEKMAELTTTLATLHSHFVSQPLSALVPLISTLDPHKKGYLTAAELAVNNDHSLVAFISAALSTRVTYSILANYLQILQNNSSSTYGHLQQKVLSGNDITLMLYTQYRVSQLRKEILADIDKYVYGSNGKIDVRDLELYCHSQKLSTNPTLLFKTLSGNQQKIFVPSTGHKIDPQSVSIEQATTKIQKMKANFSRLHQRVDNFGAQWL